MRQIYYTIRTLLRERGSNIIRIISLSLGLTIGILLFSQIAFELSYEKCYPEAERLALVRCQMTNLSTGETAGDDGEIGYDYTVFDVVAPTLAEEMPKEIEVASSVLSMGSANINCCPMQITSLRILVSFRLSAYRCWKAIPRI